MDEKEILQRASQLITDKPQEIILKYIPRTWFDKLLVKVGMKPKEVKFKVTKTLAGNRLRISDRALNIPLDVFDGLEESPIYTLHKASREYSEDIFYITAVALQNDINEPSKELLYQLRWQTDETLSKAIDHGMSQIDFQSFTSTIILARGKEILTPQKPKKMSPHGQEEIIALGES